MQNSGWVHFPRKNQPTCANTPILKGALQAKLFGKQDAEILQKHVTSNQPKASLGCIPAIWSERRYNLRASKTALTTLISPKDFNPQATVKDNRTNPRLVN